MNKNTWLIGCGIVVGIAVLVLIVGGMWAASVNNQLVAAQENMKGAWAQVETVLQRRYDLIPNLVATVKGYAAHEKEVLENVTRLRSQWGAAQTLEQKTKAANEMEGALARLLVVAEQYPDLKANQNFRDLQFELAGTENRISVERQRYNEAVKSYNVRVRTFPGALIAGMLGFHPSDAYFNAAPAAADAPKVQF
ncbi:MAG: LemA family protein [Planctomycetia bacterium]|jgi:LemA protein|nr:LemA family protein [Planctomycetia bacterium]